MNLEKPSSPLNAASDFIVLNASAGSGKTYSLVQHILLNALRPADYPQAYQKILAITFTNNAADEMKARLLKQLLEFTDLKDPSTSSFFAPIWHQLNLSPSDLQIRAIKVARHMLHNYSTLQVGTIDQFTHRLVRTFTRDLDLTDNFEVRLDLDAMVGEALDLLYSTLGEHEALRDSLVNLIHERMNRDKAHNPDRELRKEGIKSFDEGIWEELKQLPSPERLLEIGKVLDADLEKIVVEGHALSRRISAFIKEHDISTEDIVQFTQVDKHLLKAYANLRRNPLEAGVNTFKSRLKSGPTEEWRALIEEAEAFQEKEQKRLMMLKQSTAKIQQLSATRSLLEQLDALQESQNAMPLGAFNKLISQELQKEPSAFIYARLGERYWHFYIDEFQDTSAMQFSNLHPLIEHTLTKDESPNTALIVGDAKQSIYRWRGGRAEQFIALVDGSSNINRFSGTKEGHELYSRETIQLDRNFRTFPTIVHFNNAFFPFLANGLNQEEHQRVYSPEGVSQFPDKGKDEQGVVRIDLLSVAEDEDYSSLAYAERVCESTLERIEELCEEGWNYRDIALLVRSNAHGKTLANFLTQRQIPVLSGDSLVVSASYESSLLLACIKLHLNPADRESRFNIAYALGQLQCAPEDLDALLFQQEIVASGWEALEKYFPQAATLQTLQNGLYAMGASIFEVFGLIHQENAMRDACLDLLYTYQSREGSLSGLPLWWEAESKKRSVPIPENLSAVKIMTLHKSKGLEFEHVIIPFGISNNNRDSEYWVPFNLHPEISRMPVTKSEKTQKLFPADQWAEIENQEHFDWMNMVYVAMTRPVAGLHLFINEKQPDDLGKKLLEHLSFEGRSFSLGIPVPPKIASDPPAPSTSQVWSLDSNPAHLKMAMTAPKNWFKEEVDPRKWGTALHRVFQSSEGKQKAALQRLYRSGAFAESAHELAETSLRALASVPELASLKDASTIVFTERTLANRNESLRPDVILLHEGRALIVDYKTGGEKPEHLTQIQHYEFALGKVFNYVSSKVLYL